ncbi:MAG: hypothetical protein ACRCVX_14320, partial [Shewanella sp.]
FKGGFMSLFGGKVKVRDKCCETCAFNAKSTDPEERSDILLSLMHSEAVLVCHHGRGQVCHGFYRSMARVGYPEAMQEAIAKYGVSLEPPVPDMTEQEALEFLQEKYGEAISVTTDNDLHGCKVYFDIPGYKKLCITSSPAWYGATQNALQVLETTSKKIHKYIDEHPQEWTKEQWDKVVKRFENNPLPLISSFRHS